MNLSESLINTGNITNANDLTDLKDLLFRRTSTQLFASLHLAGYFVLSCNHFYIYPTTTSFLVNTKTKGNSDCSVPLALVHFLHLSVNHLATSDGHVKIVKAPGRQPISSVASTPRGESSRDAPYLQPQTPL
jgi:hypothetical protein